MKTNVVITLLLLHFGMTACQSDPGKTVHQTAIPRIEIMPNIPEPFKIIDWKKKALQFDSLAYDFDTANPYGPFIWIDSSMRNFKQPTYGLYTVIGDVRQGSDKNNGEFHEALTSLSSLISAGLMGIDKTNQDGYNYVKMAQNYFNTDNKWNIVMNNTNPEIAHLGGGYGRDWWYDVYPNVLYYGVAALFPDVEGTEMIQRKVADQFFKADSLLDGNYDYSYFDYSQMEGMRNHIPWQQDAAGGHAWVLYSAYYKFKDDKYLRGAKSATQALDDLSESRFYEILLPFGAYIAARLNAEHGTNYDVEQMLNFTFEGTKSKDGRYGWGVISERWGDYDVHGLQGSITDGGGYAFFMNSVAMAWPLLPMVKYEPRFARAIGKYMLNNVNASRLFYPDEVDDKHQYLPELKNITDGIIAYEGIRKTDDYNKAALQGISPVSIGDGPKWLEGQPDESMFSLYSTSIAGVFGAIVDTTNVKGILALDCNITDFYADNEFPVYLYYNPYQEDKTIFFTAETSVDLYDTISKKYLAINGSGRMQIQLPADNAALIVVLPSGTELSFDGSLVKAGNTIIAYE
jgi:hypothetical protein